MRILVESLGVRNMDFSDFHAPCQESTPLPSSRASGQVLRRQSNAVGIPILTQKKAGRPAMKIMLMQLHISIV